MDYTTFKGLLKNRLDALCNITLSGVNVYEGRAEDNAESPYVVYKIPPFGNVDLISSTIHVDIHFYDETGNDSNVNIIAKDVRNGSDSVYGLKCSTEVYNGKFYESYMTLDTKDIFEENDDCSHLLQSYQFITYE